MRALLTFIGMALVFSTAHADETPVVVNCAVAMTASFGIPTFEGEISLKPGSRFDQKIWDKTTILTGTFDELNFNDATLTVEAADYQTSVILKIGDKIKLVATQATLKGSRVFPTLRGSLIVPPNHADTLYEPVGVVVSCFQK